jgi:hypothetical protein
MFRVMSNSLGIEGSALRATNGQSWDEHGVVCVLVHLWVALRAQQHDRDLLTLLVTLIDQPARAVVCLSCLFSALLIGVGYLF